MIYIGYDGKMKNKDYYGIKHTYDGTCFYRIYDKNNYHICNDFKNNKRFNTLAENREQKIINILGG